MYIGTGLHEASMFELESVNLVFNNDLQITAPAKIDNDQCKYFK